MKQFLAFIRKADFVDLFKYGSFHINKDSIRQFTCKVSELSQRECVFNDLIYFSNAFDSTFEYLIIHYNKSYGRDNDITISDVQGIYPLDMEAKTELSMSLDQRIEIQNPIWPDAVFSLQKRNTFNNCLTGINNIWKIYHIADSMESVKSIISDSTLIEVIDETYENRHPNGNLPIWVYIMKYERHAFYPDNTVGCFMDTINAVFNFILQREVDSSEIEGTKIMQFLELCNQQFDEKKTFDNILQALTNEPAVENMLAKIKEIEPSCNLLKVATLFFIYRNRYKEGLVFEKNFHEAGLRHGFEFSVACYMLGFIMGHEHTYDCLYSRLPLNIFKKSNYGKKKPGSKAIKDGSEVDYVKKENANDMFTNSIGMFASEGNLLPEPIPMKKGPRGRKIEYVYTEEEFTAMLDKGYIQASLNPNKKQKKNKK